MLEARPRRKEATRGNYGITRVGLRLAGRKGKVYGLGEMNGTEKKEWEGVREGGWSEGGRAGGYRWTACWLAGGMFLHSIYIRGLDRPRERLPFAGGLLPSSPLIHTPQAAGPTNTIPRCAAKTTLSNDNNRRNVKEVSCPASRNDSSQGRGAGVTSVRGSGNTGGARSSGRGNFR